MSEKEPLPLKRSSGTSLSASKSLEKAGGEPIPSDVSEIYRDFALERYKFILNQIHSTNENVYRFLAIYQTLATALAGGAVALFVNYKHWGISADVAKKAITAVLIILTTAAIFTILLVVVGVRAWYDYRTEECDLTDQAVYPGFRSRPQRRNFSRWYETYIVAFILMSMAVIWMLTLSLVVPSIK